MTYTYLLKIKIKVLFYRFVSVNDLYLLYLYIQSENTYKNGVTWQKTGEIFLVLSFFTQIPARVRPRRIRITDVAEFFLKFYDKWASGTFCRRLFQPRCRSRNQLCAGKRTLGTRNRKTFSHPTSQNLGFRTYSYRSRYKNTIAGLEREPGLLHPCNGRRPLRWKVIFYSPRKRSLLRTE